MDYPHFAYTSIIRNFTNQVTENRVEVHFSSVNWFSVQNILKNIAAQGR